MKFGEISDPQIAIAFRENKGLQDCVHRDQQELYRNP
jgi:hypothetical protein